MEVTKLRARDYDTQTWPLLHFPEIHIHTHKHTPQIKQYPLPSASCRHHHPWTTSGGDSSSLSHHLQPTELSFQLRKHTLSLSMCQMTGWSEEGNFHIWSASEVILWTLEWGQVEHTEKGLRASVYPGSVLSREAGRVRDDHTPSPCELEIASIFLVRD